MHCALLLAVALQLEPNPPSQGEAATLTITTRDETAPLGVDIGGAAMLRRVPDGATVERIESDLHLRWQRAPERARVELVLRADTSASSLNVTAFSGTSTTTLGVKPLWRDSPPMPTNRFLIVLMGLVLSLLMWPTFRLLWRHFKGFGVIGAIVGTVCSIAFVRIWWNDFTTTPDYREGRCVITDRMLVYQGSERSKRVYSLMYAVELDGRPSIAGDSDSTGWTARDGEARAQLRRFEIGKAYPCWWSVRDRHELLLEPRHRSVTRRALVTGAVFLLVVALGWLRPDAPRRRRR